MCSNLILNKMINVNKYLLILEELKLAEPNEAEENSINHNLQVLQKFLKQDSNELLKSMILTLKIQNLNEFTIDTTDVASSYVLYMEYILLELTKNVNFESTAKEDLISTKHINLCIEAIQNLSFYALRRFLHSSLSKYGIFAKLPGSGEYCNYEFLQINIEFFTELLAIKQFHLANAMETTIRDYMAAIYTLYAAHYTEQFALGETYLKHLQSHLDYVWQKLSKLEYFRNLMLLKGIPSLHPALQKQLHQDLLQKLSTNDGFSTLVATIQIAQQRQDNEKQSFQLIAKIISHPKHTKCFQLLMIAQIWRFLKLCLLNDAMLPSMGAGLLSLRRLYDLSEENKFKIKELLNEELKMLVQPSELLTGFIVMEHKEFSLLVTLLFHIFCTSTVECLPSSLLTYNLPLLLQLYYGMPTQFTQKQQLGSCITRCLHNRTEPELSEIIETLYNNDYDANWQQLHARVILIPNTEQTNLTLKIASADYKPDMSISLALPELLMSFTFHELTYRIFMLILNMLMKLLEQPSDVPSIDLLQTDEELMDFLNSRYPVKVEILLSLNTLISHQPLKVQLCEHSKEFLQFLQNTIEKRLIATKELVNQEEQDQTLVLLLTLTQEVLTSNALLAEYRYCVPKLQALRKCTANQLVQQRISSLVALLSGTESVHSKADATPFNTARSLLESKESHLQVYGIQMLLDLLRRKDMHTLSNTHVILALGLTTLRDKESYTFLNTVRLFVALVYVMESEVLELLSEEYLNERNAVDFRLVVGEALLKVSQELGPLCYKYKSVLLNCFMSGCRSPLNEFRMSAFANLAQLCRTLSYEVHKYFHELLQLIDCELSTGQYLPAKRAAVLVLAELLAGMPNIVDFGDMLLPIYRLLKSLVASENCDEKIRLHAAKGLGILSDKCKELLFPAETLQKEIKIFGIKEKSNEGGGGSGGHKKHILEIN